MRRGFFGENTDLSSIPGEEGFPLLNQTLSYFLDPYGFGLRMKNTYGPVYRGRAAFLSFVVAGTPDIIERLFRDPDECFSVREGWDPFFNRVYPRSLLALDFEDHRRHRRIMQHVFKKPAMIEYCRLIDQIVSQEIDGWVQSPPERAYDAIKTCTLNIAARAFLGANLDQHVTFLNDRFVTINKAIGTSIPVPLPGTPLWRADRARREMFDFLRPMIAERRTGGGGDLFSRLCQAVDEDGNRFDDETILYHMVQMLGAAHDTTTTLVAATLFLLAKSPEWQDRLAGPSRALPAVAYDDLDSLTETEWVMKEAMRLYPPIPLVFRRTVKSLQLGDINVPAGTHFVINLGAIHRDPDLWREPSRFDPGRFSPQRMEHKVHPYAWCPFGGGAHTCIGLHFAMMNAKIILHHVLRRFSFVLRDPGRERIEALPLTKPRFGLGLDFTQRAKT